MRATHITILSLFIMSSAGCGRSDYCAPDAEGCYCSGNVDDVALCHQIDATFTAFCCINNGGKEVDCGQPDGCVPKPGVNDPGASGANWCCPDPHPAHADTNCDHAMEQMMACGIAGSNERSCIFTECEASCVNAATCNDLVDAFNGAPSASNPYLDCYLGCPAAK